MVLVVVNSLLTNAKRKMPGVIRLDLQFHMTNYYKKELITNY